MAMSEGGEGMVMPVGPINGYGNAGFGGDGAWWLLILFALFMGNGFGGYGYGGAPGVVQVDNSVQRGFDQASIMGALGDIGTSINATQMADMQQMFNLQSQFAQCCCDNRLATADLKYTLAQEACSDRAAVESGIRDIITNQTANTQRILDQLCNDKIDAKNAEINALERQLAMASLAASQTAQTAEIISKLPTTTTAA